MEILGIRFQISILSKSLKIYTLGLLGYLTDAMFCLLMLLVRMFLYRAT